MLLSKAQVAWEEAKLVMTFRYMLHSYEEILGYVRKFAGYQTSEGPLHTMSCWMNTKKATMEMLDKFFFNFRERIVPLLKRFKQVAYLLTIPSCICIIQETNKLILPTIYCTDFGHELGYKCSG